MDPLISAMLVGLTANLITVLPGYLWQGVKSLRERKDLLRKTLENDTPLMTILQRATTHLGSISERRLKKELRPAAERFLTSPEADMLLRRLYSSHVAQSDAETFAGVQTTFTDALSLYIDMEQDEAKAFGDEVFSVFYESTQRAIAAAIEKGNLAAHEAQSILRFRVLRDELLAIKKAVESTISPAPVDIDDIASFEESYRREVTAKYGQITPPDFDTAKKWPIGKLYVPPTLARLDSETDDKSLSYDEFVSEVYRAVVLGDPGGGKSTLVAKIASDAAANPEERLVGGRQATPMLVVLRDYGTERKKDNCSIAQFIEKRSASTYQLVPPVGALDYMLRQGRSLVIFDGMDELLETSDRREITGAIESFCRLYPTVPVIVTSRRVGYEQAPLDPELFEVFSLMEFDDSQVTAYVGNWFETSTEVPNQELRTSVTRFMEESEIVSDLRKNPLMLALMCNLYRGQGYIPKNRPDVYEKCAMMLFERWDKSRGIHVSLPFEEHIRPTVMFLAHWVYENPEAQEGVPESRLVEKAVEYLFPRRFDDENRAEHAARDFIQFCKGRAWVFTDAGTTDDGEALYKFTHSTFLEYFTARYLARKNETADKLVETLLPRILRREWDVPAQLAFQIKSRDVEDAGDRMLRALLERPLGSADEHRILVSFAARCLEFIVPSPAVIQQIVDACVACWIHIGRPSLAPSRDQVAPTENNRPSPVDAEELLNALQRATNENQTHVVDALVGSLAHHIKEGEDEDARLAIEIADQCPMFGSVSSRAWQEVASRATDGCDERRARIYRKWQTSASIGLIVGRMGLADFVKAHGIGPLFKSAPCSIFEGTYSPPVWWLTHQVFTYSFLLDDTQASRLVDDLRGFAAAVAEYPPPWEWDDDLPFAISHLVGRHAEDDGTQRPFDLDADALFAALVLCALALEADPDIAKAIRGTPEASGATKWARLLSSECQVDFERDLSQTALTESQRELLLRWSPGEAGFWTRAEPYPATPMGQSTP
ncbi:hypothetical protein LCGC14_0303940 [marine sediment metagenome]|uniref:NACHT domain-containing protein n=1 Tax=marine sediment metagenome TaxID=412755 RepID=A0A0F9TUH3_9ZZZZ|nr:NACHT domain-containing protein [Phycisphaerae bacterium]HDZ42788.1 NACHT domain-containing protein [Phycisphaerae bacterium]